MCTQIHKTMIFARFSSLTSLVALAISHIFCTEIAVALECDCQHSLIARTCCRSRARATHTLATHSRASKNNVRIAATKAIAIKRTGDSFVCVRVEAVLFMLVRANSHSSVGECIAYDRLGVGVGARRAMLKRTNIADRLYLWL